jgi:hypothetical protein
MWPGPLRGANLHEADLTDAKNLTLSQINTACVNENTKLPASLKGLIKPSLCLK